MTSISPRAPWDRGICRCVAAAALVLAALNPFFFSGHPVVTGMVFGAQGGADAAIATRTVPPARTAPSKQTPTKPFPFQDSRSRLKVKSKIALVVDANTSEELLVKNADKVVPIASITKLMTAMVVIDAKLPPHEMLRINNDDRDLLMGTSSRLQIGWALSREDMLHLALMSSENRAAAALSRYYPGGRLAFIRAMNAKAAELGMTHTHFVNPNGLTNKNVSTAIDLADLVQVADQYPLIREFTTDPHYDVRIGRYILSFFNTNRLVGRPDWDIDLQKTGFTNEAGDCVVMRVNVEGRSLIMIFLDATGKLTRFADARRVRLQLALLQKK